MEQVEYNLMEQVKESPIVKLLILKDLDRANPILLFGFWAFMFIILGIILVILIWLAYIKLKR